MKAKNITLFIFLFVAVIELLSIIFGWDSIGTVHITVKPLLMPSLAAFFFFSVKPKNSLALFIIIALLFSWLGDIMLIFQELKPIYFMLGLVSFLLAHITYIVVFNKSSQSFKPKIFTYSTGFLLAIYGILLLLLMWPGLGDLKIPVIIYTIIIMTMGITALFRRANGASLVLIGAMLFIASDSLLALNKFYQAFAAAGFWVMLTYILAQYLIVIGMISYFSPPAHKE
jgi:uncharacterized membrane protein YhhN